MNTIKLFNRIEKKKKRENIGRNKIKGKCGSKN